MKALTTFYVGTERGSLRAPVPGVTPQNVHQSYVRIILAHYEGATIIDSLGLWYGPGNVLVREPSFAIQVLDDRGSLDVQIKRAKKVTKLLMIHGAQDSVGYSIVPVHYEFINFPKRT